MRFNPALKKKKNTWANIAFGYKSAPLAFEPGFLCLDVIRLSLASLWSVFFFFWRAAVMRSGAPRPHRDL